MDNSLLGLLNLWKCWVKCRELKLFTDKPPSTFINIMRFYQQIGSRHRNALEQQRSSTAPLPKHSSNTREVTGQNWSLAFSHFEMVLICLLKAGDVFFTPSRVCAVEPPAWWLSSEEICCTWLGWATPRWCSWGEAKRWSWWNPTNQIERWERAVLNTPGQHSPPRLTGTSCMWDTGTLSVALPRSLGAAARVPVLPVSLEAGVDLCANPSSSSPTLCLWKPQIFIGSVESVVAAPSALSKQLLRCLAV